MVADEFCLCVFQVFLKIRLVAVSLPSLLVLLVCACVYFWHLFWGLLHVSFFSMVEFGPSYAEKRNQRSVCAVEAVPSVRFDCLRAFIHRLICLQCTTMQAETLNAISKLVFYALIGIPKQLLIA